MNWEPEAPLGSLAPQIYHDSYALIHMSSFLIEKTNACLVSAWFPKAFLNDSMFWRVYHFNALNKLLRRCPKNKIIQILVTLLAFKAWIIDLVTQPSNHNAIILSLLIFNYDVTKTNIRFCTPFQNHSNVHLRLRRGQQSKSVALKISRSSKLLVISRECYTIHYSNWTIIVFRVWQPVWFMGVDDDWGVKMFIIYIFHTILYSRDEYINEVVGYGCLPLLPLTWQTENEEESLSLFYFPFVQWCYHVTVGNTRNLCGMYNNNSVLFHIFEIVDM